jgi:hypothetical protein
MEHEAERQIDDRADDDGDDVVFGAADRNWRGTRIGAAFQGNAIIHRPGEYRPE